jgi:predicted phosphodiesterase
MKNSKLLAFISVMVTLFFVFTACGGNSPGGRPGGGSSTTNPNGPPNGGSVENGGGTGNGETPTPTTVTPRFITNNFGQDSSRELLVQWHNDTNVAKQALQIVEESGDFENAREIIVTGVTWNPTRTPANQDVGNYLPRNIFRAEVKDLTPGTQYKYRVGNEAAWSDIFYHLTSGGSNANFSFTVAADTQSSDAAGMRVTFRAANAFDEDNRFFLIAGDIVNYPQLNPQEFPNFTAAANEFNIRRPIATTQGNHDTYINSHPTNQDHYMFGSAEVFNSFTVFPENGWNQGAFHGRHRSKSYYFYYNNVLIVMLNTMATQNATGPSEPNHTAQVTWLRQVLQNDLDNNLSRFRIIVTHIPIYGGREDGRWASLEAGVRNAYGKLATDFDVDIFFSGHDHVYVRSQPLNFTVASPALNMSNFSADPNGTIFSIPGGTGTRLDRFRNPVTWGLQFFSVRHALCDGGCGVSHSTDRLPALPGNLCIAPGVFVNIQVTDERMIVTAMRSSNPPVELDRYEITPKR